MRLEFINRLQGNEVLGKNILTNDGQILLRSGVTLSMRYVKKLESLGVLYVYVEDERLDDIPTEDEQLGELKRLTMKRMSNIMKNISQCSKSDLKESLTVVEDLVDYIIKSGDVNKSLYDVHTYDNYTYVHSLDTCIMSSFLGLSLGYNEGELKSLGLGAVLHDIGKTKVPFAITTKKGRLTNEEMLEMKRHPEYGEEILKANVRIPENVIKTVAQHHERIDGRGYPHGISGSSISKFARVVCICDVYDAVSNDRSYRAKFNPNDAYELILAGSGNAFDEDMVKSFKETFAVYPLGCCVRLSNGIEGYVIKQNKNFPDRPVIRVLYDSFTRRPLPFYEINLLDHLDVIIENIV